MESSRTNSLGTKFFVDFQTKYSPCCQQTSSLPYKVVHSACGRKIFSWRRRLVFVLDYLDSEKLIQKDLLLRPKFIPVVDAINGIALDDCGDAPCNLGGKNLQANPDLEMQKLQSRIIELEAEI